MPDCAEQMTTSQVDVYKLHGPLDENALFTFLDGSTLIIAPRRHDSTIEALESAFLYNRKGTLEAAAAQDHGVNGSAGWFWRNIKSSKMPYNTTLCQIKLGEYLEAAVQTGKKTLASYLIRGYGARIVGRLHIDDHIDQCLKLWEIWKITSLTGKVIDYLKKDVWKPANGCPTE